MEVLPSQQGLNIYCIHSLLSVSWELGNPSALTKANQPCYHPKRDFWLGRTLDQCCKVVWVHTAGTELLALPSPLYLAVEINTNIR